VSPNAVRFKQSRRVARTGLVLLGTVIRTAIGLAHLLRGRRTRRAAENDTAVDESFPVIPPIANGSAPIEPTPITPENQHGRSRIDLSTTEAKSMIVLDLMTRGPASVRPEQDLALAARLMWNRDCGALPVVDESRKVIGMITDRDICMATWSQGRAPNAIFVAEVMSKPVVSCRPEDSISRAESIMRENQVRRLPVIGAQDELVGVLSLADIARVANVAPKLGANADISGEGLVATLAGICTTPPPSAPRPRPGAGP
jgi:CBS domain-containing protein